MDTLLQLIPDNWPLWVLGACVLAWLMAWRQS